MAVFYDSGGGDIYGGPNKEAIAAKIIEETGDARYTVGMFEVGGNTPMRTEDSSQITIAEEYGDRTDAVCVASENC